MIEVHVLAPALSPPAAWVAEHRDRLPRLPAIERCIAVADCIARVPVDTDFTRRVFALFGMDAPADRDLPVAAATHWVDFDDDHDGNWLRADPVHLRPDLSRLLLFDSHHLSVTDEEASEMAEELNAHLHADGLQLFVGRDARRWYLRVPGPASALKTTPPDEVHGRHIDGFLPFGPDAARWHRLFNEVQMLLHQSPANAAREQRGEPAVNSVWFWGAGTLTQARKQWDIVITDAVLVTGLARSQGSQVSRAGERLTLEPSEASRQLLCLTTGMAAMLSNDLDGWCRAVGNLDRLWFAPLLAGLRHAEPSRISIHLANATCSLQRRDLRRFWRRRRSLFA